MKRFIISIIFVVAMSFGFASSASAQLNVPVPSDKTPATTKSPDINVPVPNKSSVNRSSANVYRTYRNTTVVKKYMNGTDKDARAKNVTQDGRLDNLESEMKGKANSNDVEAGFKSVDDRFAVKDQVDARQDRELGYTFWAFIIIPFSLLILALLYFVFGGRNNNVMVNGGGHAPAYVPQAQPAVQPMPYYQPVPAQPIPAAQPVPQPAVPNQMQIITPINIRTHTQPFNVDIDLNPTIRGGQSAAPAQ